MQCRRKNRRSRCSIRWGKKKTAASARDEYGGNRQMTKEEVNDDRKDEERRRNATSNRTAPILIPYSDACSINIQLHQDRVALSILLPFSRFLPADTRSRTFPPGDRRRVCMRVSEGLAKDEKGRREEAECMHRRRSTVYKVEERYNNICASAFQIDFSEHWSLILRRTECLHPAMSRRLPLSLLFLYYLWIFDYRDTLNSAVFFLKRIFSLKKIIFIFTYF